MDTSTLNRNEIKEYCLGLSRWNVCPICVVFLPCGEIYCWSPDVIEFVDPDWCKKVFLVDRTEPFVPLPDTTHDILANGFFRIVRKVPCSVVWMMFTPYNPSFTNRKTMPMVINGTTIKVQSTILFSNNISINTLQLNAYSDAIIARWKLEGSVAYVNPYLREQPNNIHLSVHNHKTRPDKFRYESLEELIRIEEEEKEKEEEEWLPSSPSLENFCKTLNTTNQQPTTLDSC